MLTETLLLLLVGLVTAEVDIEIQKKYEELPFSEFVSYFNGLNLTWTITEYSEQYHFTFGVKEGKARFRKSFPVVHHKGAIDLPDNFDSRRQWPHCDSIRTINNQYGGNRTDSHHCGSCWIFGSIDTASDRTCIHKNINVLLSEAEGTCIDNATVCDGGDPQDGFQYWVDKGLVTKQCENYTADKAQKGVCKTECENPHINYKTDKHFGEEFYAVDNSSIREELVKNGPVEASMDVYEDFIQYKGGIYDHKYGKYLAGHSVRIIGYGTEGGVDYWLVANSWGTTFGEKGFFRIKRFIELELEDLVLTGLPKN